MPHVFSLMPPPYRRVLLAVCLAGSAGLMLVLTVQGMPLRNPAAPLGVVSFELARTQDRAEQILESWRGLERTAERQLLIDFGFLIVYPALLALCCAMLSEAAAGRLQAVGVCISWAVLAAGPLDALENIALLQMLRHGAGAALAQTAAGCASLKFLAVFFAFGYIAFGGYRVVRLNLKQPKRRGPA
jgi:hypothetical protein